MKRIVLILVLPLILHSCRTIRPNEMFNVDKDFNYEQFQLDDKEYKIKPFDKLEIRVFTNDGYKLIDLSSGEQNMRMQGTLEYLVEHDGLVKVPTLGRIELKDFTLREAEKLLEKEYANYYQNPFVQIRVTNRKVYVFKNSGSNASVLNIPDENMTLIEALAQSGGLSDLDQSYRIKLIRGDITKNPKVYKYNIYTLKDISNTNLILEANDIIYVESRPKYVNRILGEINPYLSLITTVLLVIALF
jgi:polysaccharide biosynthesis/export protein